MPSDGMYCGPVADLVDPYAERTNEESRASILEVKKWMRDHPGRWVMFGEGEMGVSRANFEMEFEVRQKSDVYGLARVFARKRHPKGESLERALARTTGLGRYPADLPDLEPDPFGWTQEELDDAVRASKEMLNARPGGVRRSRAA